MERERWPDKVREFVDAVVCPHCAAARSMLMVTVHYSPSPAAWLFRIYCTVCRITHQTEWLDMFRMLNPKAPEPEKVPLPAWVAQLGKETG